MAVISCSNLVQTMSASWFGLTDDANDENKLYIF